MPAMQAPARVIRNTRTLMTAASRLGIPMLLTEQYPKGLGHIVPELQNLAKNGKVLEKMHFSCMNEPSFAAEFKALDRRQTVIRRHVGPHLRYANGRQPDGGRL